MNASKAVEQLTPLSRLRLREVNHGSNTRVVATPDSTIFYPGGGKSMEITEVGMDGLQKITGIARGVVDKLTPKTMSNVATELLAHKGKYDVLHEDGRVVGFTPPHKGQAINPERIVAVIDKELPGCDFSRIHLWPESSKVAMEVVAVERSAEVAKGDIVQAGALVEYSPLGTMLPTVQSYVRRLKCTNGMTDNIVLRDYKDHGGGKVWPWFRKALRDATGALFGIVARYREMVAEGIPKEQRAAILEALIKSARLDPMTARALRQKAVEEPPENTYDAMNILSFISSNVLKDPTAVRRAQNSVAEFAREATHRRVCPVCQSGS